WAVRLCGSGQHSTRADLKSQFINRRWRHDEHIGTCELMVLGIAASSRRNITELIGVECIFTQARVGKGIACVQSMASGQVRQFTGGFRLVGSDRKSARLEEAHRQLWAGACSECIIDACPRGAGYF